MSRNQQGGGNPRPRSRKRKTNSMGWRVIKTIVICLLVAFAALAALAVVRVGIPVVSMYRNAMEVVDQSTEDTFKAEQTSLVYDVDGNEIKKLKGEKDVHYLEYEDIPDAAKLAIIAIEDKNFTSHRGIDIEGIARARSRLSKITERSLREEVLSHSSLPGMFS